MRKVNTVPQSVVITKCPPALECPSTEAKDVQFRRPKDFPF